MGIYLSSNKLREKGLKLNLLYEKFIKDEFVKKNTAGKICFHNYREFEYENKLYDIIESTLKFIKENTTLEFEFDYDWELNEYPTSVLFNYSEAYILTIKYKYKYKKNEVEDKLEVLIPRLVDKHFFYLRDNIYIPVIKLKDRAIRFGSERILFEGFHTTFILDYRNQSGQFNPKDENLCLRLTTKKKLPLHNFIYEMFKDDKEFMNEISKFLDFDFNRPPNHKKTKQFIDHLVIFDKTGKGDLNEILTNVLFSDYNKSIYELELGFRPKDIKEMVKFIFTNFIFKEDYSFAFLRNLQNRRFVFLDDIMKPFFRTALDFLISNSMQNKGVKFTTNKEKIISTFIAGDVKRGIKPGKYIYDYASVYTGVKANIAIQMEGEVKKFMRSLHTSFQNIICPISTSSSEPGVQIHINPDTELTYHGHIISRFKPLISGIRNA